MEQASNNRYSPNPFIAASSNRKEQEDKNNNSYCPSGSFNTSTGVRDIIQIPLPPEKLWDIAEYLNKTDLLSFRATCLQFFNVITPDFFEKKRLCISLANRSYRLEFDSFEIKYAPRNKNDKRPPYKSNPDFNQRMYYFRNFKPVLPIQFPLKLSIFPNNQALSTPTCIRDILKILPSIQLLPGSTIETCSHKLPDGFFRLKRTSSYFNLKIFQLSSLPSDYVIIRSQDPSRTVFQVPYKELPYDSRLIFNPSRQQLPIADFLNKLFDSEVPPTIISLDFPSTPAQYPENLVSDALQPLLKNNPATVTEITLTNYDFYNSSALIEISKNLPNIQKLIFDYKPDSENLDYLYMIIQNALLTANLFHSLEEIKITCKAYEGGSLPCKNGSQNLSPLFINTNIKKLDTLYFPISHSTLTMISNCTNLEELRVSASVLFIWDDMETDLYNELVETPDEYPDISWAYIKDRLSLLEKMQKLKVLKIDPFCNSSTKIPTKYSKDLAFALTDLLNKVPSLEEIHLSTKLFHRKNKGLKMLKSHLPKSIIGKIIFNNNKNS